MAPDDQTPAGDDARNERAMSAQRKRNLPPDPERGALIRRLMDAKGYTEQRLAKDLTIGVRTLSAWRRGDGMRRSAVPKLADALGVDPAVIIGPHGEAPPSAEERLVEAVLNVADRRRAVRVRGDFEAVSNLLGDMRGADPDASLSSLREDVQALKQAMVDLQIQLQELGVLGESGAGPGRSAESESVDPASGRP